MDVGGRGAISTSEDYPALNSYRPTDADRDHTLRVQVRYTDGHGAYTATLTSGETGVVTDPDHGPEIACWPGRGYLV